MKLNKGIKMPDFQYLNPYAEGPQSFSEYENGKKYEEALVNAYIRKTGITRKVFERKCKNGTDWVLTDAEIEKYGITTRSSDGWLDILANAIKKED